MDLSQKAMIIKNELDKLIKDFDRKRNNYKRTAFWLKVISIFLGSTVTVLLGLKTNDEISSILKNAALVCGAGITIVTTIDAFFDYRSLWVGRTFTMLRMRELRRELEFYITGMESEEIEQKKLNEFLLRFNQIMKDDALNWMKLRESKNSSEALNSTSDGGK